MSSNKLVLGTVQMGLSYGINNTKGQVSKSEGEKILSLAYNHGVLCLDTAKAYGESHDVIGSFHDQHPTTKFKVNTKLSEEDVKTGVEGAVKQYIDELRVEQIDVLMFHSFDQFHSMKSNLEELLNLKEQGKFKKLGVSVYTNEEILQVISCPEIDVIQVPFNLLDNHSVKGDLLAKAKVNGKEIHSRSAFLQGLFFKDVNEDLEIVKALKPYLKVIHSLSKQFGLSVSQLSLQYCLVQDYIDKVIIGVDSHEQMISNFKSLETDVPREVIDKINEIKVDNLSKLNPSKW